MAKLSRSERRRLKHQKKKQEVQSLSPESVHHETDFNVSFSVIIAICAAVIVLFAHFFYNAINIKTLANYMHNYLYDNKTYEEKMEKQWPVHFFGAAKKAIPRDAVYMYPPQASWLILGNGAIDRYFLTPRKMVAENRHWVKEKNEVTHILKTYSRRTLNQRWPLFYVPVKKYHPANIVERIAFIQNFRVGSQKITKLDQFYSDSENIYKEIIPEAKRFVLAVHYENSLNGDYLGEEVNIPLTEERVVSANIYANKPHALTLFAEIDYGNDKKIIFESRSNSSLQEAMFDDDPSGKKQIEFKGKAESIIFSDLYENAKQLGEKMNWPTENMVIVKAGINSGIPIDQYAKVDIGVIAIEHGLSSLEEIEQREMKDGKYYLQRAHTLKHNGKIQEAKEAFEISEQLNPNEFSTLVELGDMYRIENNTEKSLEYYQKGHDLFPDNPWFPYLIGNTYKEMKNYEQAVDYYKRAGNMIMLKGDYFDTVHAFFNKVLKNNSNSIDISRFVLPTYDGFVSLALGELYEEMGNIEQAKKFYTFIAWNAGYSWDAAKAWEHLKNIAPEMLKIMPIP